MARWFSATRDYVIGLATGAIGTTHPVPPGVFKSAPGDVVLGTVEQPALNTDRLCVGRYVGRGTPPGLPASAWGSNERDSIRMELRVSYRYDLDPDASSTRPGFDRQELARCRAADDAQVILVALAHPDNYGDAGNGVSVILIEPDGDHRVEDPRNGVSVVSVFPLRVEVASSRTAGWDVGTDAGQG